MITPLYGKDVFSWEMVITTLKCPRYVHCKLHDINDAFDMVFIINSPHVIWSGNPIKIIISYHVNWCPQTQKPHSYTHSALCDFYCRSQITISFSTPSSCWLCFCAKKSIQSNLNLNLEIWIPNNANITQNTQVENVCSQLPLQSNKSTMNLSHQLFINSHSI